MRILAVIVGILLLLPGACFSFFGFAERGSDGPGLIAIGVLILLVAGGLIYSAFSRRR